MDLVVRASWTDLVLGPWVGAATSRPFLNHSTFLSGLGELVLGEMSGEAGLALGDSG